MTTTFGRIGSIAVMLVFSACAQSHMHPGEGEPAEVPSSGVGTDGPEGGAEGGTGSPTIECGPNVCRDGEVCCDALCGVCTAPETCLPEVTCSGYPQAVCSGVVCAEGFGGPSFCCPGCEGDVCPPDGVGERSGCPPVTCD